MVCSPGKTATRFKVTTRELLASMRPRGRLDKPAHSTAARFVRLSNIRLNSTGRSLPEATHKHKESIREPYTSSVKNQHKAHGAMDLIIARVKNLGLVTLH